MNQNTEQIEVDSMSLCDHLISKGYRPTRSKPNPLDNRKFIYYFEANDAVQQIIDAYEPEQEQNDLEKLVDEVAAYDDGLKVKPSVSADRDKKARSVRNERRDILVTSLRLAEWINDAGYFRYLNGVQESRKYPGQKIYYYEQKEEIRQMVEEFQSEYKAVKARLDEMTGRRRN